MFIDYSLIFDNLHKRQRRPAVPPYRQDAQKIIVAETRINVAETRINVAETIEFVAEIIYNDYEIMTIGGIFDADITQI